MILFNKKIFWFAKCASDLSQNDIEIPKNLNSLLFGRPIMFYMIGLKL